MTKEYFKCSDCWRVYDKWQLTNGPLDSCYCGSRRFKNSFVTKWNNFKAFVTDWKYFCFGEKAYDK